MEDLTKDFENLKLSAVSKLKIINEELSQKKNEETRQDHIGDASEVDSMQVPKFEETSSQSFVKSNPNLPFTRLLTQLETERRKEVNQAVSQRINQISEFSRRQEQQKKENLNIQCKHIMAIMQQQETCIFNTLETYEKQNEDEHNRLVDYYQKQAEQQRKNMLEIEEKERTRRALGEVLDDIKKNQMEARNIYQEIAALTKTFDLKTHLSSYTPRLKMITQAMEDIIGKCKTGRVSKEDGQTLKGLLIALRELKQVIEDKVKNLQMEKEIKSQQHQEQQQRIPLQVDETHLKKHVNPMDFQTYTELILFHKDYKSRYADLQSANNLKQFREGFRKAINITVNAISSVSSSHLSEKYDKLHRLLSGQQIIIGDAPVSASSHPQGVYYCTDLLAEKFVTQGDVTISTNPKSAFCYAAVIVALWNDFPEFGKLLMAHMYRTYPCLVPFYIPRRIGQTNEEYYRSLGYKYDSNRVVEEQGKYLKRLSGLVRLHSAIFVTRPKRGHKRNPRGLDVAWKWLTSVLNLEPRLDVTATMLHVFLDTAGVYMQNTFRKQFLKIVNFLRDTYVPMLRNIDTGGPVSRLELLLQEYTLHKHFQQPSGILPNNFW